MFYCIPTGTLQPARDASIYFTVKKKAFGNLSKETRRIGSSDFFPVGLYTR